jgi:hypothetical protein
MSLFYSIPEGKRSFAGHPNFSTHESVEGMITKFEHTLPDEVFNALVHAKIAVNLASGSYATNIHLPPLIKFYFIFPRKNPHPIPALGNDLGLGDPKGGLVEIFVGSGKQAMEIVGLAALLRDLRAVFGTISYRIM